MNTKDTTQGQKFARICSMKEILNHQILRLAKIYLSRKVNPESFSFHARVVELQIEAIKSKNKLK